MAAIFILEESDEHYAELFEEVTAALKNGNRPPVIRLRKARRPAGDHPKAVIEVRKDKAETADPDMASFTETVGSLLRANWGGTEADNAPSVPEEETAKTDAAAGSEAPAGSSDAEETGLMLGELYPVLYTQFIPRRDGSYANAHEAAGAVREMIQYNYMKPDSARQYAARVHISLTYLCRAFRRETGKSIGGYILQVRMQRAADHLAHSNLMIKEVARAVGYSNFSYFCRRFRAFYNMTPAEYREKCRAGYRKHGRKNGKKQTG